MKRGELITVQMLAYHRLYGRVTTSAQSAIREMLHEALDVWIDEIVSSPSREALITGPERQVTIEVSG